MGAVGGGGGGGVGGVGVKLFMITSLSRCCHHSRAVAACARAYVRESGCKRVCVCVFRCVCVCLRMHERARARVVTVSEIQYART